MDPIIVEIRQRLEREGTEAVREGTKRFFKEPVKVYGLKAAAASKVARDGFKVIKGRSKSEIFALCDELWRSGYLEESGIACEWSWSQRRLFEPADFAVFERWVGRDISNWAQCDTFCNHTVGAFLDAFPEYVAELDRWAVSPNRWMRRAAAVSLIVPVREGRFLPDAFRIADIQLVDPDDMVQKGYGWLLKVASHKHLDEVFSYVMMNRAAMPRTALRYAIEKMPADMKARAMQK
jgi:3-methyladenine DNA glycosylase AlkD